MDTVSIINLVISLLSGVAGGNVAGAASKNNDLGTLGNSVAGLFGGGLGGYILQALGVLGAAGAAHAAGATPAANTLDIGSIIANIIGSGAGGAILSTVISLIKKAMAQK